jgi:uncharacterized membrane protein
MVRKSGRQKVRKTSLNFYLAESFLSDLRTPLFSDFLISLQRKDFQRQQQRVIRGEMIIFSTTNDCMDTALLTSVAMGIALSASCGFRVFVPMLGASFAAYQQWFALPADMQWMGSLPAVLCFATAAILEIAAYYIPFVDNLLDTIATPLAVAAGTVLAASFLPIAEFSPMLKWILAIIAGGGAAGTVQIGTGLLRLFSSKTTAGVGNAVVSTGENAAAIGGTALSFTAPVLIAVLMLLLIGWILVKGVKRLRK